MNVRAALTTVLVSTTVFAGSIAAMAPQAAAKKAAGRVIEITGDDTMKFNLATIDAKPGEQLTVRLTNKGTMPKLAAAHNFVLVKIGTDVVAFGTEAVMAGPAAEYIPAKFKAQVIAATALTGPGESAEISFRAPTAPGAYPYLCSFPGHYVTMKGIMNVK